MLVYKINEELTIKRHCEELVLYLFDDEIAKEKYIDDPTATDYLTFKMLDIFLKDYKKYNKKGFLSGTLSDSLEFLRMIHSKQDVYNNMLGFFNVFQSI